ncbi:hypothetical protein [Streptomyces sp. DT203]|uniref:hypothetical protein n=1 Tax=Streptomyces sp. DT203 TaxID=3393424 RepID=UPI003CE99CF9
MQMSESYAATIAAVVPVIWLVAAVEVQQYAKMSAANARLLEGAARHGQRLLDKAGERPSLEDLKTVSDEMSLQTDQGAEDLSSFPPRLVPYFWSLFVGVLIAAETVSLYWLGADGGGPHPGWAWFCLVSTLLGFVAITVLPAFVGLRQMRRSIRMGMATHAEVRQRIGQRMNEIRSEHGL